MGHIPDDDNFQDFMNASAEEWSKPEEPSAQPKPQQEKHDRWGSPIQDESAANDVRRWGSEPVEKALPKQDSQQEKKPSKLKGWIIAAVVIVVLGVCACLVFAALEIFQVINIF